MGIALLIEELGGLTLLPPDTALADVLPSGPVYELSIMSPPGAKLYYSSAGFASTSQVGGEAGGSIPLPSWPTPTVVH